MSLTITKLRIAQKFQIREFLENIIKSIASTDKICYNIYRYAVVILIIKNVEQSFINGKTNR